MVLRVPGLAALAIGVLTACGCSSVDTKTGPAALKCQVGLTLGQPTIPSGGGAGSVTVAAQPECAWTAASEASWITGLTPTSGQGNGVVRFQVAVNASTAARNGTIVLNDIRASVTQAGDPCVIVLSNTNQQIAAGGASGTVGVSAPSGCPWSASSDSPWLVVTSGASGSGDGSVGFSVGANAGAARSGAIAIAGQSFVVTQLELGVPPPCIYVLQPTAVSLGAAATTSPVGVQVGAGCAWTSTSNASWLTFVGASTGSGNGSVTLSAAANTGNSRTGTATIAGQTFTVAQAGSCAVAINIPAQTVVAAGGNATSITVTAASGCGWTSATTAPWITITSGATGSGNGTVAFTVAANTGPARAGTVTIGGQLHTVTQTSGCTVGINPASQTVAAAGGTATAIAVTTATGCAWSSVTSDPWITITSGASGSGNGTISFTVAANSGAARTGTITVSGQVHTVIQSSGCTVAINPAGQTVAAGGGTATPIAVTAAAGCGWNSVASDPWITITSGASGTGNGTVNFTVAANSGAARTGTVTVSGQVHTVTQNTGCTFSINPTSQNVGAGASNNRQVAVTASAGCTWTATSNASWLTVTSGASGTGNGTVRYDIAQNNTGSDRVGTITIAGITFTVNQNH